MLVAVQDDHRAPERLQRGERRARPQRRHGELFAISVAHQPGQHGAHQQLLPGGPARGADGGGVGDRRGDEVVVEQEEERSIGIAASQLAADLDEIFLANHPARRGDARGQVRRVVGDHLAGKAGQGHPLGEERRACAEHLHVGARGELRAQLVEEVLAVGREHAFGAAIVVAGKDEGRLRPAHLRFEARVQAQEAVHQTGARLVAVEYVAGEDEEVDVLIPERLEQPLVQPRLRLRVGAVVEVGQVSDALHGRRDPTAFANDSPLLRGGEGQGEEANTSRTRRSDTPPPNPLPRGGEGARYCSTSTSYARSTGAVMVR